MFDVGGVLIAHDNDHMFRTLASRCRAANALDYLRNASFGLADGKRPVRSVYEELAQALGYSGDWDTFAADICCHFTLDRSMLRLVQLLAESNRVLLFSNTFDLHWNYVTALEDGALQAFEAYASHVIGDAKPAESAFRKVIELAGIDPRQSIFIDDLAENVAAAERVGFRGHHFKSQSGFEHFLRDAGPNWSI